MAETVDMHGLVGRSQKRTHIVGRLKAYGGTGIAAVVNRAEVEARSHMPYRRTQTFGIAGKGKFVYIGSELFAKLPDGS